MAIPCTDFVLVLGKTPLSLSSSDLYPPSVPIIPSLSPNTLSVLYLATETMGFLISYNQSTTWLYNLPASQLITCQQHGNESEPSPVCLSNCWDVWNFTNITSLPFTVYVISSWKSWGQRHVCPICCVCWGKSLSWPGDGRLPGEDHVSVQWSVVIYGHCTASCTFS